MVWTSVDEEKSFTGVIIREEVDRSSSSFFFFFYYSI
jgi:hypothetical protein